MKRLMICVALVLGTVSIPTDAIPQPAPATTTIADTTGPAAEPADSPLAPTEPKDVAKSVGNLIDATRTGSWIAIVGGVIMLLLNLLRLPQLGSLTKKIPRRWRLVVAVALGGVGGILAGIAGGMPWYEAVAVGLFSGPAAVFSHEAVLNTILGKRDKKAAEAQG